jgi:hypothetical protein
VTPIESYTSAKKLDQLAHAVHTAVATEDTVDLDALAELAALALDMLSERSSAAEPKIIALTVPPVFRLSFGLGQYDYERDSGIYVDIDLRRDSVWTKFHGDETTKIAFNDFIIEGVDGMAATTVFYERDTLKLVVFPHTPGTSSAYEDEALDPIILIDNRKDEDGDED